VVDKSGSMDLAADPSCSGSCPTRLEEMKAAMDTFLSGSGSVAHLGMLPFPADNACGAGDLSNAAPLDTGDDDDARLAQAALALKTKIDALTASGGTPTGATLTQLGAYPPL